MKLVVNQYNCVTFASEDPVHQVVKHVACACICVEPCILVQDGRPEKHQRYVEWRRRQRVFKAVIPRP